MVRNRSKLTPSSHARYVGPRYALQHQMAVDPTRLLRGVRRLLLHPLAPLIGFSLALTAFYVGYLLAGYAPSNLFLTLTSLVWGLLLPMWVVADARRSCAVPCFDFGFLCWLALPVSLPWYCFWSRGWRGAFVLFLIAGLFFAPYLVASAVWQAMYG